MKNIFLISFLAGLLILSSIAIANANMISNGSFEVNADLFSGGADGTMKLNPSSTELTGWNITGSEIAWMGPNNIWNLTASAGSYFLDLTSYSVGGSGGVAQASANTVVGQSYTLTFDLGSSDAYGAATDIWAFASAGGVSQQFNVVADSSNDWDTFSLSFIATSTSSTIELTGMDTAHTGYYIGLDNVQLTADPVPEPATMLLFGIGLLGLAGVNRRKK